MEPYSTALNTANTLLATMAAVLLTVFWRRVERTPPVGWWALAAWAAVPSIALVFLRPWIPATFGIVISTALYTTTHVLLVIGARVLVGKPPPTRIATLVVAGHLVLLIFALAGEARIESRMLVNSAIWATLAAIGAGSFPAARPGDANRPFRLPQAVLAAQGCFHAARLVVLLVDRLRGHSPTTFQWIQTVSFVETGLFVVGVFAGLLMYCMLERNQQLARALTEVKTLSGLLPICSGCKNIRDQQGQWKPLEEYIQSHSHAEFTHGICDPCGERLYGRETWRATKDPFEAVPQPKQ